MQIFCKSKAVAAVFLAVLFVVQLASAQETQIQRSAVVNKLLKQQRDEVSASLRSDIERFRAIMAYMSNSIERNDAARARRAIPDVVRALADLRLSGHEKNAVYETLICLDNAIDRNQDIRPCSAPHFESLDKLKSLNAANAAAELVARTNQHHIVADPLTQSALRSPTPAALRPLQKANRAPYAISFYGQSVDVELGRLFRLLARHDPDLLRPIPIDEDYQFANCLNGPFSAYVGANANQAAARYKSVMAQASEPHIAANGDVMRFGLWESSLSERIARVGGDYPTTLETYTSDMAYSLLRDDFSDRYGLTQTFGDDPVVDALMTLWVVRDAEFEEILSNFLQTPVRGPEIGLALAKTGLRGQPLWQEIFQSVGRFLHCSDANNVLEAYSLTYRGGDYPSARETLDLLRSAQGYPAVPNLRVTTVKRRFIEDKKPNCSVFGPVERRHTGDDATACHLGEIDLGNGQRQYLVQAGGARVEFLVTPEERERLAGYMKQIESIDRNGDVLRWTAEGAVEVDLQSIGSSVALSSWDENWEKLPCVMGMSYYIDPTDTELMVEHFKDYRRNFYPKTDSPLSNENWQLYIIDEFDGFRHPDFTKEMLPLANRLAGVLATVQAAVQEPEVRTGSILPDIDLGSGDDDDSGTAPSLSEVKPDLDALCEIVEQQLFDIKGAQDLSHGAFLESLLFAATNSLADVEGLGLLNDKGDLAQDFISRHYSRFAAKERLDLVSEHVGNLIKALEDTGSSGNGPVAIFNVSMGKSYANQGGSVGDVARSAIDEFRINFLTGDRALFVLAAGQPTVDTNEVRSARDLEALTSRELIRSDPNNLHINHPDCSFFPACFSNYKNVITVGAVKPSPSGFGKPVITPWSNYGSAVTLAAPGQGVLGNDLAYLPNDDTYVKLKPLPISSLRDGTSVATVFVTALAAKIASEHPDMNPAEIKMRLISTARPYVSSEGREELLRGEEGQIYAGVIDPTAALRDPRKYHVTFRAPREDGRLTVQYDIIQRTKATDDTEKRPLWLFDSYSTSQSDKMECDWTRLLRLHFEEEVQTDDTWYRPIPRGAMVCETGRFVGDLRVGAGTFGTTDVKQNTCLAHDTCFQALSAETGGWVPLKISEIRDIYFPSGP